MNDRITLAQAHCQPREKKEHKLGQARLAELLPQVPGWELSNNGHALTPDIPIRQLLPYPRIR